MNKEVKEAVDRLKSMFKDIGTYGGSDRASFVRYQDEVKTLISTIEQQQSQIEGLVELIDRSATGLEWKLDNEPETFSEADGEHLNELKEALTKHKQERQGE